MQPYNQLLTNSGLAKKKRVSVELKMMKPREYIFESSLHLSLPPLKDADVQDIKTKMSSGERFPIPVLHYGHQIMKQDGRHRAKAAELLGIVTIPVMVVHDLDGLFLEDLPVSEGRWKTDAKGFNPNGSLQFIDYIDQDHNRFHFNLKRKSVDYHGDPIGKNQRGFEVFDLKTGKSPEEITEILKKARL